MNPSRFHQTELCSSEYLELNREEYYDRLLAVSRDNDWTGWVAFFLRALTAQADTNQAKAQEIHTLYRVRKDWIAEVTHSQYAVRALDWIFSRPIFKTTDFVETADIPKATANRILRIAKEQGLLTELTSASGRRPAILAFAELLNVAEGGRVF